MPSPTPQQLHTLLQQQLAAAGQLLDVLKGENEALVQRDTETIQNIAETKIGLTQELEKLGRQQNEFLNQCGYAESTEGLNAYLASQTGPAARVLQQQKDKLRTLLEEGQTLNLINGNIIAASKQSAETAIAILRGQVNSENITYSAGGQAVKTDSKKPIIKA